MKRIDSLFLAKHVVVELLKKFAVTYTRKEVQERFIWLSERVSIY